MKTYVKPMMESEAFVANEYVAACWTASCLCGAYEEDRDSLYTDVTSYKTISYSNNNYYAYGDSLGNVEPCVNTSSSEAPSWASSGFGYLFYLFLKNLIGINPDTTVSTSYHLVTLTEGWTVTNHPNAS